jgi:dienelactone hydrolase
MDNGNRSRVRFKGAMRSYLTLSFLLLLAPAICSPSVALTKKYITGNRPVTYEIFNDNHEDPILILLHGASGPDIPLYREQAQFFAGKGYAVVYPHYFDASKPTIVSKENYEIWFRAITDLVLDLRKEDTSGQRKIALLGFSLGSSVALAVGSQAPPVDAIVDWYGSLPDTFFDRFKGMPPLLILHGELDKTIPVVNALQLLRLCELKHLTCENHIFPGQSHGFIGDALVDADHRTLDFLARRLGTEPPT